MKRVLTCAVLTGVLAFGVRPLFAADNPAAPATPATAAAPQTPAAPAAAPKAPPVTLPPAAADAIKAAYPNAKVGTVTTAGRGAGKLYIAHLTDGQDKPTVSLSESGVIVYVTTPATEADLPKAVADAVKTAVPDGTMRWAAKVEQRADQTTLAKLDAPKVTYDFGFGAAIGKMTVAADGTVIKPPPRKGAATAAAAPKAAPGYQVLRKLALGGTGKWDYLTVDSAARRLYISRATHVMVIDLDTEKVVGDIPHTSGVHGIVLAPDLNRGFTSNGTADTVTIFDRTTLAALGQVKTGTKPDSIVYDPASKRVFAFNGHSNSATVFDAATGKVLATIPFSGKPESGATDGQGKVYVNIEDKSELVEIDSDKLVVNKSFPLKPGEGPTGIAVDPKQHRVYSGCANNLMTILDTQTGSVIATVPIGADVDANGFDPETALAFSSNGDGTLTVVRESAPGKFEAVETVATFNGAKTMALDPKTHAVYVPATDNGIFTLLVIGTGK